MSPADLCASGSEEAHQRALTAWVLMAQHRGFRAANDISCYTAAGQGLYREDVGVVALANYCAVPLGGKRDKATAQRLKATGTKAGYPDVLLDVPTQRYHGLRIELKKPDQERLRDGGTSAEQRKWLQRLNGYGYLAVVCYGWSYATQTIQKYLS